MSIARQASVRNRLLHGLTPEDFALLEPHLKWISLPVRTQLVVPEQVITQVWFVESGIVSVVASMPDGRQVEAGIIGSEGIVDIAVVNGADRTPLNSFVQVAGEALRMPAADLRRAMAASPALRTRLMQFVQTFLVQVAHTAFANAANTIEERLARWLLMATDRVEADEAIAMTHEFLSVMLGVRRAGVTMAVQALVDMGAIRSGRGRLEVIDRAMLESVTRNSYGPAEGEYRRIFGISPTVERPAKSNGVAPNGFAAD